MKLNLNDVCEIKHETRNHTIEIAGCSDVRAPGAPD